MGSFIEMVEGDDGWCEWVYPPLQGYRMKCCGCGLVHEMEFKAFAETKQGIEGEGTYEIVDLPWPIRVMFRAKRVDGELTSGEKK